MSKTPEKNKSKRQATSPVAPVNDVLSYGPVPIKSTVPEHKKRMKKYQFAPVNNLNTATKPNGSILRSISVSQIRNTANTKDTKTLASKPPLLQRQIKKLSTPIKLMDLRKREQRLKDSNDFFPSQEVIWKYSPNQREYLSDKNLSSQDYDNTTIDQNHQNILSTPIVPNRLKSIISFSNINDIEREENSSPISMKEKYQSENRKHNEFLKESLRDIEDILDDIVGNDRTKPENMIPPDIPSSPTNYQQSSQSRDVTGSNIYNNESTINTKIHVILDDPAQTSSITKVASTLETKENEPANCDEVQRIHDDDDDDSLIEMLTQKSNEATIEKCNKPSLNNSTSNVSDKYTNNDNGQSHLDFLGSSDDEMIEAIENSNNSCKPKINKDAKIMQKEIFEEHLEYINLAKCAVKRKGIKRYVILNVKELTVPNIGRQKILSCINADGEVHSVITRHPWVYLEFEEGDVIHIVEGQNYENKRLLSDDKDPKTQVANDNLLILNPDLLLSATAVGSSIECLRRAVLQASFQDTRGDCSAAMTLGNIVHELLQTCLKYKLTHNNVAISLVEELLDSILESYNFAIILCNETKDSMKEMIMKEHMENVFKFINQFVSKNNFGRYVSISGMRKSQPISISNIIDIEENIWSPMFGLKGYLDATVEAHVESEYFIAPLEVKTGKMKSISHEAQGLVYTLLLNDRYELPIDFFLLVYTRYNDMTKFNTVLNSLKHVLMFRNQISIRLKHRLTNIQTKIELKVNLPPLLGSSFCDTCFVKSQCMTLNNLLEDGTPQESGLKKGEYELLTNHLLANIDAYKQFFRRYNDLITKEESSISCMNKELFLLDGKSRESKSGHCIANLVVSEYSKSKTMEDTYIYVFERADKKEGCISMLNSQLMANDYILISDEIGHFALSNARVISISKSSITVSTTRMLLNNKVDGKAQNSSVVQSVLTPAVEKEKIMATQNLVSYRIDKNEIHQGLSTVRFNLLNLFLAPVEAGQIVIDEKTGKKRVLKASEGGDMETRLRIIDMIPPSFRTAEEKPVISYQIPSDKSFNENQLQAIDKVMRANDYTLILGMPGTGKTTVIAEIMKILVSAGKSVLLAAYTHSAVDNVLLKLKDMNGKIVRLGSQHRIHPEIMKFVPTYSTVGNYGSYLNEINDISVVATTCLGISDIMLSLREKDFDYIILDEASQVSLPVALGPLRYGKKFIMVGDHFQLPPLVKNDAARLGGLDISPFQLLSEKHPQSVVTLTYQYRMCEDISTLSNFLIYNGRLKCGNKTVSTQKLSLPKINEISRFQTNKSNAWLNEALDPLRKVIFLNYDNEKDVYEKSDKNNITNESEVTLTYDCVQGLLHSGLNTQNIGVMTLYRGQIRLLNKKLESEIKSGLEVLTADQFQGRDKECIIISLVRSNEDMNGGALLREIRRVNVAMTRAKAKLIIIGSKKTIGAIVELKKFIELLDSKNWIYELPTGCLTAYKFIAKHPSILSPPLGSSTNSDIKNSRNGVKQITENSKIIQKKPILKQIISEL